MSQHYLPKCMPITHPCSFTHVPENVRRELDAEDKRRELYTGLHGSEGYRVNIQRAVDKNPIARQNDSSQVCCIMDMDHNLQVDKRSNVSRNTSQRGQSMPSNAQMCCVQQPVVVQQPILYQAPRPVQYVGAATGVVAQPVSTVNVDVYEKINQLQQQLHELQVLQTSRGGSFHPDVCQPIPHQHQQQHVQFAEPLQQQQQQQQEQQQAWDDEEDQTIYNNATTTTTTTKTSIPAYTSHTDIPLDSTRRPPSANAWPVPSKKKRKEKTKPAAIDEENVWQSSSEQANQKVMSHQTKQNATLSSAQQQNMVERLHPRVAKQERVKKQHKEPFRPGGKKNPGIPKPDVTKTKPVAAVGAANTVKTQCVQQYIQQHVPTQHECMVQPTHHHSNVQSAHHQQLNVQHHNLCAEPTQLFPHMTGSVATHSTVIDPKSQQHALAMPPPPTVVPITEVAINRQRNHATDVFGSAQQHNPVAIPVVPHISLPEQTSGTQLASSFQTRDELYNDNRARNQRSSVFDMPVVSEAPPRAKKTFVQSDSVYAQSYGNTALNAPASSRAQHESLQRNRTHNQTSCAFDFAVYQEPNDIQEITSPLKHCSPIFRDELNHYNAITERSAAEGHALSNRYRQRNHDSGHVQDVLQQKQVTNGKHLNAHGAPESVQPRSAPCQNTMPHTIHSDVNIVQNFLAQQTPAKEIKQQQLQSTFNPMYQQHQDTLDIEDPRDKLKKRPPVQHVESLIQRPPLAVHSDANMFYATKLTDNMEHYSISPPRQPQTVKPRETKPLVDAVSSAPVARVRSHSVHNIPTNVKHPPVSYYASSSKNTSNNHTSHVTSSVHSDVVVVAPYVEKPQSNATLDVLERRKARERLKHGFEKQEFEFTIPEISPTLRHASPARPVRKCEAWSISLEEEQLLPSSPPVEHTVEVSINAYPIQTADEHAQYQRSMNTIRSASQCNDALTTTTTTSVTFTAEAPQSSNQHSYNISSNNSNDDSNDDEPIEEFVDLNSLLADVENSL